MTHERSLVAEFVRSNVIGPAKPIFDYSGKDIVSFDNSNTFSYPKELPGMGLPIFWKENEDGRPQEIIHFNNENPVSLYGAGILSPKSLVGINVDVNGQTGVVDQGNLEASLEDESLSDEGMPEVNPDSLSLSEDAEIGAGLLDSEDFEVAGPNIYRPSTLAVTFCINKGNGTIRINFPAERKFSWQEESDAPFLLNGRYEQCKKKVENSSSSKTYDAWRRRAVFSKYESIELDVYKFEAGKLIKRDVPTASACPINLVVEVYPRSINDLWIVSVVLRNSTTVPSGASRVEENRYSLFQTYFEVSAPETGFKPYPEGTREFDSLDLDEQSLSLLYRDSAVWAIGHGCAAGWEETEDKTPKFIYADVMPAVELPSMTPDIEDDGGNQIKLSMRTLAELDEYSPGNVDWETLEKLSSLYSAWIDRQQSEIESGTEDKYKKIAEKHIEKCRECLDRIDRGIELLKNDPSSLAAFKLANKSMLYQQISTKMLGKRQLEWNGEWLAPGPQIKCEQNFPSEIYQARAERGVGEWRAFQIAFLLMSLEGLVLEDASVDREVIDLIWFPTGGGKTEAYLAVAAFEMFHKRVEMCRPELSNELPADGTNVFMRYTLRMLTTQQFQRAASLICAMEFIRINESTGNLGAARFGLGLWIGSDGAPNTCTNAITAIKKYRKKGEGGNPLVLTECPWCRSEIGRVDDDPRGRQRKGKWEDHCLAGIEIDGHKQPYLKCTNDSCHFGGERGRLCVEVIDEKIYKYPPSLFIGTADKFAMIAYKPEAGSLFGRSHSNLGEIKQIRRPPSLIIQDEFHLIAGPLGTIYGLYESVIEELCSYVSTEGKKIKPKIVASTATIRGAELQAKAVYGRGDTQLFPSPGLSMGDSFFGRYARNIDGSLKSGRLYFGMHAHGFGSFLTTQVRVFAALLFRAYFFSGDSKDPWWTLLAFYNSLRELGGARTLFSSDIASRLKNLSYRYGCEKDDQRYLNVVEELTSRQSQSGLVQMMDRLSQEWSAKGSIDSCLASSIIEVGVDIDRLSLMAIVGQPKSTAQYIQVSGRVGRRWWERPGLIFSMYNPAKSRDRSHFEQFHSYHRRLYERVEPTSATPFSVETINRVAIGALLLWARQFYGAKTPDGELDNYLPLLDEGRDILLSRCDFIVEEPSERRRVRNAIDKAHRTLIAKWRKNPLLWWEYPQKSDGEYLMLWPGQFATRAQEIRGAKIPSSMRNVDSPGYLNITDFYLENSEG